MVKRGRFQFRLDSLLVAAFTFAFFLKLNLCAPLPAGEKAKFVGAAYGWPRICSCSMTIPYAGASTHYDELRVQGLMHEFEILPPSSPGGRYSGVSNFHVKLNVPNLLIDLAWLLGATVLALVLMEAIPRFRTASRLDLRTVLVIGAVLAIGAGLNLRPRAPWPVPGRHDLAGVSCSGNLFGWPCYLGGRVDITELDVNWPAEQAYLWRMAGEFEPMYSRSLSFAQPGVLILQKRADSGEMLIDVVCLMLSAALIGEIYARLRCKGAAPSARSVPSTSRPSSPFVVLAVVLLVAAIGWFNLNPVSQRIAAPAIETFYGWPCVAYVGVVPARTAGMDGGWDLIGLATDLGLAAGAVSFVTFLARAASWRLAEMAHKPPAREAAVLIRS